MAAERAEVVIVGAGPAGLMLSHLLAQDGVSSVILDSRSRDEIEQTIRAGILEQGTIELLDSVVGDRTRRHRTVGDRHEGIELRFDGVGHRIDLHGLTGRSVWLYPQHEVLRDLIDARLASGQDIRFRTRADRLDDIDSATPRVLAQAPDGTEEELIADIVVGADGSHSMVRKSISGPRSGYFREYPFAWFGILCEALQSAPELIYSNSPDGFALISQRSETVQRMYFQCDPETDAEALSEREIWDILGARVPGVTLNEGPIFQRDVLRFRSFVASDLRRGRVVLAGDAAHTVPPTGAKGLNLAIADTVLLAEAITRALRAGSEHGLAQYHEAASRRIWRAQHFSWWMTNMTHLSPDMSEFDRQRQLGELRSVTSSEAGSRYLAEAYTGWPFDTLD